MTTCFVQLTIIRVSLQTQNKEERSENNIFVIWGNMKLRKIGLNNVKFINNLCYVNVVFGNIELTETCDRNKRQ